MFGSLESYSVLPKAFEISCSLANAFDNLSKNAFFAFNIFTDMRIRLITDIHRGIYRVELLSKEMTWCKKKHVNIYRDRPKPKWQRWCAYICGLVLIAFLDFERYCAC